MVKFKGSDHCMIYRLVMLAKLCHNISINKVVNPVATAEFYDRQTKSLAPPITIPEKSERGTRKALNILSDSTPEAHCQVTLADM